MGREGSSAALEPEEMRRGGTHGQCHGDGEVAAAELRDGMARAQEGQGGKLERRSGWGRRVEKLGTGGGAGERPRCSTWPGKRR
jgi:hypothetical protein